MKSIPYSPHAVKKYVGVYCVSSTVFWYALPHCSIAPMIGRTDEVFATEYGMEMRKKWGVPDDMVPVCNVLLGYREGPAPHDKPRKEGRILRV